MRKFKNILPLVFALLAFAGCKKLYDPEISVDQSALVIEGRLTNTPGELIVKISKAVSYDSDSSQVPVPNCIVKVKDGENNIYSLTDNGDGSYSNNSLFAQEGQTYSLNVVTADGDEYQSGDQVLPPIYKQDSIYAAKVTKEELVSDSYGGYFKSEKKGIETYVDLSSSSDDSPKCRYTSRVTVLYYYPVEGIPPSTMFGWKTFTPSTEINLTTSTFEKTQGLITKHSLCFFESAISVYDTHTDVALAGFLLALKKYNLTSEAYSYYKSEKEQMEASGKIFDPTPAQVYGNLKCVNNPDKSIYGFFEVTNVEQLYYRYNYAGTQLTQKDGFPEFTDSGGSSIAPAFWFN
jgi:hypothetical protein